MVYFWYEDDGGFEYEKTYSTSYKVLGVSYTGTTKFKIKNDDDVMGHIPVDVTGYCPGEGGYTIGGGSGTFSMRLYSK